MQMRLAHTYVYATHVYIVHTSSFYFDLNSLNVTVYLKLFFFFFVFFFIKIKFIIFFFVHYRCKSDAITNLNRNTQMDMINKLEMGGLKFEFL